MKLYEKIDGNHFTHFESLDDLYSCEVTEENRSMFRTGVEAMDDRRGHWFGGARTWTEVQKIVRDGWAKGVERGQMLVDSMRLPNVTSVRRKKVRRDFGDHLDIHRVYAGDLAHAWESSKRESPPMAAGANATVVIDSAISAGQHADELFWNGAAACAIVKALIASGRNVQVILKASAKYRGTCNSYISVTVKEYRGSMDLDRLFATIAFAGFFRGWIFKAWCTAPVQVPYGYGTPERSETVSPLWPRTDSVIWVRGANTKEKAEALLKDVSSRIVNTRKNRKISY